MTPLMIQSMTRTRPPTTTKQVYLSAKELIERWRGEITDATLTNWRWKKQGPAFIKVGTRVLYKLEDVEAFETAGFMNAGKLKRAKRDG